MYLATTELYFGRNVTIEPFETAVKCRAQYKCIQFTSNVETRSGNNAHGGNYHGGYYCLSADHKHG